MENIHAIYYPAQVTPKDLPDGITGVLCGEGFHFPRDEQLLFANLKRQQQLRTLQLAYCNFTENAAPGALWDLATLQELTINTGFGSYIAEMPDSISRLASLQRLELFDVNSLPDGLGRLTQLTELFLASSRLPALPGGITALSQLQVLDLADCAVLTCLPHNTGALARLTRLTLANCKGLTALPASIGGLTALRQLHLDGCASLHAAPNAVSGLTNLEPELSLAGCVVMARLPKDLGALTQLRCLDLTGCSALKRLPDSITALTRLSALKLEGCTSLAQPQPDERWPPLQKVKHVLVRQRHALLWKYHTGLLTSVEHMSWLVLLLATATFIGFLQPPGGYSDADHQVLAGNMTRCLHGRAAAGDVGVPGPRLCAMLVFFALDALSFSCSVSCLVMIVLMSMPREQLDDKDVEAGRFWLLLVLTWMLLYLALASGFGAFVASAAAVYSRSWVLSFPFAFPGAAVLTIGSAVLFRRFAAIFPGWPAVRKAVLHWVRCR